MNENGYSLSDIAAVSGARNDGMFGGNGDWGAWIILFLIFGLFGGWGGRGFGFGGGNGEPCATQADVRAAVDQQTLTSKLDQQTYGLADSTYALNNSIMNGFHGVDSAICNLGYNVQSEFNTLGNQMASCCCETQRQIERGFADTNYNMATQACETRQAIADSTRSILDFLTQDKISTLTAENQNLKFQASQTAQNQFITQVGSDIVNRLHPVAIPAYTVPNPNAYYGCGCNAGCGC